MTYLGDLAAAALTLRSNQGRGNLPLSREKNNPDCGDTQRVEISSTLSCGRCATTESMDGRL